MAKNNAVYENLLKSYNAVVKEKNDKIANACAKIAEAEQAIKENEARMTEAISAEDQETYMSLFEQNQKHKAVIDFYEGVLEKVNAEDMSALNASELMQSANAEINKLMGQYEEKLVSLMQPIIELSANTCAQVNLLRLAQGKIHSCKGGSTLLGWEYKQYGYDKMPLIVLINQLLQSEAYRQADLNPMGPRNNWDAAARDKYAKESAKWL